ncbi:hypothetical protein, partial [Actinomadura sp. HBU206391]|uniref:hypothetical protein n=1 Tax=Actinomadura sp. HBU206391 TaxID=2731692 RepID=UPI001C9CDFC2
HGAAARAAVIGAAGPAADLPAAIAPGRPASACSEGPMTARARVSRLPVGPAIPGVADLR